MPHHPSGNDSSSNFLKRILEFLVSLWRLLDPIRRVVEICQFINPIRRVRVLRQVLTVWAGAHVEQIYFARDVLKRTWDDPDKFILLSTHSIVLLFAAFCVAVDNISAKTPLLQGPEFLEATAKLRDSLRGYPEDALYEPLTPLVLDALNVKKEIFTGVRRFVTRQVQPLVDVLGSERGVLRPLTIFAVWRDTPADIWINNVRGMPSSLPEEVPRRFVRVHLGFPGAIRAKDADPWELFVNAYMEADFPLESDGSLDLTLVARKWNCEQLTVLDPNRMEPFVPIGENILSPLAVHLLSEQFQRVTVVEHMDWIVRSRNAFRQWFLASWLYFGVRLLLKLTPVYPVLWASWHLRQYISITNTAVLTVLAIGAISVLHKRLFGPFWVPTVERMPRRWIKKNFQVLLY